jgi:hypothetical protein
MKSCGRSRRTAPQAWRAAPLITARSRVGPSVQLLPQPQPCVAHPAPSCATADGVAADGASGRQGRGRESQAQLYGGLRSDPGGAGDRVRRQGKLEGWAACVRLQRTPAAALGLGLRACVGRGGKSRARRRLQGLVAWAAMPALGCVGVCGDAPAGARASAAWQTRASRGSRPVAHRRTKESCEVGVLP